jgi:pyruvate/2-oxoglutarate/acetoin dehydrogenase E1 component
MTEMASAGQPSVPYWRAVNQALADAMEADTRVVVFGEDVGSPGGIFGVTRNLQRRFGAARVFDTPSAEASLVGVALGASMNGLRPVLELMFLDFGLVAADQIINHVAKARYISGDQVSTPLVLRTQQGVTPGSHAQHSQNLEALFAHMPGIGVMAPYSVSDAYWMLRAAIADDRPTLVIEHRALYTGMGVIATAAEALPPDRAAVVRAGTDLTLVSWSRAVRWATDVADRLAAQGVSAEVIDLRSLVPLDLDTVVASARRTGHVVVLHEAVRFGGFGAEVAASVSEVAFHALRLPVQRFGAASTPTPAAPGLQEQFLPDLARVTDSIVATRAVATSAAR